MFPSFQTRTRFNPGLKPVVLRLERASGSPGELAGLQIARPHPQSWRGSWGPRTCLSQMLIFCHVPR